MVAAPGAEPDAAAILAHAERQLARYKLPRELRFVDSLPRNRNGKLMRRELHNLMRSTS
jgi:acyl-coenzyme A synthetase/AMP-(fatty) acid ligase